MIGHFQGEHNTLGHFPLNPNKAITRYFTHLDPVLQNYWKFANTLEFQQGDSFEFEFLAGTAPANDRQYLTDGEDDSTRAWFLIEPSGKYNLQFGYRMSVYVDDTQITNSDYAPFDGKVHKVRLELLRAASLNYLGARKDVTGCYNGIFANPAATINGSTQKFTLGNSYTQGDTEISKEGDNSITRVLVPAANIEQYQLSSDKTQWDNISPLPQELSATIEVA